MAAVDIGPANHTRGPGHAAGHTGTAAGFGQILVSGASPADVAGLVAVVVALTAGAVMIPFGAMRRREPSLTAA